eukprot:3227129-Ditylum_brightwellii.AAC.1
MARCVIKEVENDALSFSDLSPVHEYIRIHVYNVLLLIICKRTTNSFTGAMAARSTPNAEVP